MSELGYLLTKGKGVKKDLKEAARWYRTAVSGDHNRADKRLLKGRPTRLDSLGYTR